MTRMKRFGDLTGRLTLVVVLLLASFIGGTVVGYNNRSEIERVVGIVNTDPASHIVVATGTASELSTCIDNSGAEVPCLLDREDVRAKDDSPADFEQYWKAWNVINEKFVPVKGKYTSNEERVWGSISGLANSLGDPYTYFMPPQEKALFEQDVRGIFGGVGMQIGMRDGIVTVIAPLKDSPAERAGILKGDRVLEIDGATTTGMTIDKALYLIRGEVGKSVRLVLLHEGEETPFTVNIIREEIKVPTIDSEVKDDVYIIRLYQFPGTGAGLFQEEIRKMVESGAKRLVLDLRGNPGGYLEVSVDMASWFLPEGKVVVREEEKGGGGKAFRSAGYNIIDSHFFGGKLPMAILVDGGSASAAEILAGALRDHGVATLVGTKTFGKGSVQELVPITDDTSLKITVARWITPGGVNLSDGGLTPDVIVDITKEDVEAGEDPQLEKALEVVRAK